LQADLSCGEGTTHRVGVGGLELLAVEPQRDTVVEVDGAGDAEAGRRLVGQLLAAATFAR